METEILPLHRGSLMEPIAESMAKANYGRFPTEFADPIASYRQFLTSLVHVDGVEIVAMFRRYALGVVVGHLFDPEDVAEGIAWCIGQHLYPGEELTIGYLDEDQVPAASVFSPADEDETVEPSDDELPF